MKSPLSPSLLLFLLICVGQISIIAQESDEIASNTVAHLETSLADSNDPEASFEKVLEFHLESVTGRDLKNYMSTVGNTSNISMIFPSGAMANSHQEVEEMHTEWFKEKGWEFKYEILKKEVTEELAYALLDVDFYEMDEQNTPDYRPFYLVLIFSKTEKGWKLVHDQCTPNIPKKRERLAAANGE